MHLMDKLRSWKEPLVDEWATQLGAKCMDLSIITSVEPIGLAALSMKNH